MSLQEYLTLKRLEAARSSLLNTNATVKEIAPGCGLVDEQHLIRIFRRHYAMTPSEYRNKMTTSMHALGIDSDSQRFYNEKGLDNLAKSQGDGEFTMFGQARSKQMILAAAMSLLLLLSACGTAPANTTNGAGTQNTPPAVATTQTPAAATKAEEAWPRTYVDASGAEVVIEKQPERVAILHFVDIERLYALGVTPIASALTDRVNRMQTLEPLWNAGIIDLGEPGAPNLEKLIEIEPDLIIAYSFNREARNELAKIAPVVEISDDKENRIRELGEMFGKEEEAEKLTTERSIKLAETREQLSSVDETIAFLYSSTWVDGKTGGLVGQKDDVVFYIKEGLGLKAPDKLPDVYGNVSLEGLVELNPDHIFMRGIREEYEQAIAELSKSSVWNSLSAVKNGEVYWLEESLFMAGPVGVQILADYVIEKLLK